MIDLKTEKSFAPRTVGDSVYHSLREAILSLRLKPGETINIKDVAEKLNISRSPVRDALMRLSTESLVDIFPQRGCRVSLLSLQRIDQELFFREGLETFAITNFIPIATEEDFAVMQQAIEQQQLDIAANDIRHALACDAQFHATFFKAIGQEYSLKLIEQYCVHYQRFRLLSGHFENNLELSMKEHIDILQAIKDRDVDKCLALEKTHMHHIGRQQKHIAALEPGYFE